MVSLIKKYKLIFFLASLLLVLFLFVLILQIANYQRMAWGLRVAEKNIGGMKYDPAKEKISQIIEATRKKTIEIRYQSKHWVLLPEELGVNFDLEQTTQNAYLIGHQPNQNLVARTIDQIESLFDHKNLNLAYRHDKQKVVDFIKNNLSDLETPAQGAKLIYDSVLNDFIFSPAQNGEVFDACDLKNQISKRIDFSDSSPIQIKKITQWPTLLEDKNNQAKIKARKILVLAPYQLKYNNDVWLIEKETILEWLDFVPVFGKKNQTMTATISEPAVKEYLLTLTPSINKDPVNAKLSLQNDKVVEFVLSQNGTQLKIEETAQKIAQEIGQEKREIELVVKETPPQISSQTIDTLGLINLVGQGTSNFAGSPKNRIHNIGIGAARFNGLLLKPGQEFSFNENLSEIGPEQGYLPELVIKKNKTIPEYGGGLCQVSTTLFRAAVNSGLKITERYPHAFPVRYYSPQGFDATVYPPHPDLRFVNDTPNNLLIQSKIKGTKLFFELYGTKDEREIKVIGPTILQSNPDGSMKTVLYQEIWHNETLERKDSFWSNYKSPDLYPTVRNPLE